MSILIPLLIHVGLTYSNSRWFPYSATNPFTLSSPITPATLSLPSKSLTLEEYYSGDTQDSYLVYGNGESLVEVISRKGDLYLRGSFQSVVGRQMGLMSLRVYRKGVELTDGKTWQFAAGEPFDFITVTQITSEPLSFEDVIGQIKTAHFRKVSAYCQANGIEDVNYTAAMLTRTLSQQCREVKGAYTYYGICFDKHENKREKLPEYQIDVRYSPLIISLLFNYDCQFALWLYEQLISLLHFRMFYGGESFVEVPEHIQFVRMYLHHEKAFPGGMRLRMETKAVLNGYINQMLLSDVSVIEEQVNYREKNIIHPAIRKMLALSWKARSMKSSISSLYEQSFTPDFYYNSHEQGVDLAVSKISWLVKVVDQFAFFVGAVGDATDRAAQEQSVSLVRILVKFVTQQFKEKMLSILLVDGLRVYAHGLGYQNLLPFCYKINNIFPEEIIHNLTTTVGLASMQPGSVQANSNYAFRSNINVYFNYKILKAMLVEPQRKTILKLAQSVRTVIITQGRDPHWSWDIQGKPTEKRHGLALINSLFLSTIWNK